MQDFIGFVAMVGAWFAAYFAIVTTHEFGHYTAGLVIGVPSRLMRICLFTFPQHVALRDGDVWISPVEIERYIRLAEPLMPTTGRALLFVAGGFVMETLALFAWTFASLPFHHEAACLALIMTVGYLLSDAFSSLRSRRPALDFSAMCSISPVGGSAIASGVLLGQIYLVVSG